MNKSMYNGYSIEFQSNFGEQIYRTNAWTQSLNTGLRKDIANNHFNWS